MVHATESLARPPVPILEKPGGEEERQNQKRYFFVRPYTTSKDNFVGPYPLPHIMITNAPIALRIVTCYENYLKAVFLY